MIDKKHVGLTWVFCPHQRDCSVQFSRQTGRQGIALSLGGAAVEPETFAMWNTCQWTSEGTPPPCSLCQGRQMFFSLSFSLQSEVHRWEGGKKKKGEKKHSYKQNKNLVITCDVTRTENKPKQKQKRKKKRRIITYDTSTAQDSVIHNRHQHQQHRHKY